MATVTVSPLARRQSYPVSRLYPTIKGERRFDPDDVFVASEYAPHLCPHGFAPDDGCFACLGIDLFDWVTPEHLAIAEREARTGDIPVA